MPKPLSSLERPDKMLEVALPIEEWVNNYAYPCYYVDYKDRYFTFRPFFEQVKPDSIGAEIGTFEGYNALGICRYTQPKKLFLVDPYKVYESSTDTKIWTQGDWEKIYRRVKLKLKDYPVEFFRMTSEQAVKAVPNNELDYVYIDADHSFEAVLNDIKLWAPKVKTGGLIGGHDIIEPEVLEAVAIFVKDNPLIFNSKWNDWWIKKT